MSNLEAELGLNNDLSGDLTNSNDLVGDIEITTLSIMDVARFGADPSATAAENVSAFQDGLDIGGIITCRKPGTYEINDTLWIGSNTRFICSPGVILKKTGDFSNVLVNKGALTRTYNENIIIDGLTVEVNGVDNTTDLDIDGLRGQLGFYYVEHFSLINYRCEDLDVGQFGIQFVRWRYIFLKNITLEGEKDGIDLGVGHDGLFENLNFTTHDDAIALYVSGFPSATVEIGDVYNITFRNVNDFVKDGVGYTCRILSGSWADWLNGNTYQTGDICVNVGNAYICNNANGFSAIAANAPVHASGTVVGADTISWRYLNACAFYHGDVYNVTFDNFNYYDVRGPVDVKFLDNIYMRSVYPGTETLSEVYDIRIINSTVNGPAQIVQASANVKNILISNCIIEGVTNILRSDDQYDNSNPLLSMTLTGCHIRDVVAGFLVNARKNGMLVSCRAAGNVLIGSTIFFYKQGTATIRLVNTDIPFTQAELADLSPVVGDICMATNGFYVYRAGGWFNLAV